MSQVKLCAGKFDAKFQLFDRIEVNGKNAAPIYQFLRSQSRLTGGRIGWNFGKFLISRQGRIVSYNGPKTKPEDMKPEIEKLLNESMHSEADS